MFREIRTRFVLVTALLASSWLLLPPSGPAQPPNPDAFWQVGTTDGLSDEFGAGAAQSVDYRVGSSTPKQWRAVQDASTAHPSVYRVVFPLHELPAFPPVLDVEIYFLSEPPEGLEIQVNGRRGYYRIVPAYGEDIDSRQAMEAAYTRQSLRIPLPLDALHAGENQIALSVTGGEGSLRYDSLALLKSKAPVPDLAASVEPTIFFQNTKDGLQEIAEIVLRHQQPLPASSAVLELAGWRNSAAAAASGYDFGEQTISISVPAISAPAAYTLTVVAGDRKLHATGEFRPERRWQIFAALRIHNDIGFTDLQPNVQELDARNADRVIDIAQRFPSFKFNFEDAWPVDNYIHSRTSARASQLLSLATRGRVSINPIYLNLLTGLATGEELYRSLYFAKGLERSAGVPIKSACLTDVPTPSWFIPSLLSDSGISYFASGGNQSRSLLLAHSRLNENSPFYWEGADGRRVLAWFARNYRQFNRLAGDRPTIARMRRTVPQFLARYRRPDYPVDAVMLYGLYGDNTDIRTGDAAFFDEWNRTFAYPRLSPATDADYFDYISARYADRLPVYRGDAGSAWEDGAGSTAAETALNRDTQRLLPAAEAAAALATASSPDELYPAAEFRDAWKNVLFSDEHSWGASESRSQPARERVRQQWEIKRGYVNRAHDAAEDLLTRSLSRLVQNISVTGPTLFVFNFATAARTGPVEIELGLNQEAVDLATNKPVAADVLDTRTGFRRVRFLAENVPAFGYKAYAVRSLAAASAAPEQPSSSWSIESRYYRVDFDPASGAIRQIHDKELDRDLVDPSAGYKLNELLYVAGGENTRVIRDIAPTAARLDINGQSAAKLISKSHTPLGERIRIGASSGSIASVETEVAIYNDLKRIDIANRVHKDDVQAREAVYFAFPFQVPHAELSYEIQNVWVRPNADQLPGAPREWFATQNGVEAHAPGIAVAWTTPDAPLITLTGIDRGRWQPTLDITNAHIYSWVMNNYWSVNYKASQGGDYRFRYFITTARDLAPAALAAFSSATRSPLIPYDYYDTGHVTVTPAQKRMPAAQGSFFTLTDCPAQLSTLKQAEDGAGLILRLHNPTAAEATCRLESPVLPLQSAHLTDGVENNVSPVKVTANSVTLPLKPHQFATVRLTPAR
jgi:hypothetical protein